MRKKTEGGTTLKSFLNIDHYIHILFRKALSKEPCDIKDRIECFDDYFPPRKKKYMLKHMQQ